MYLAVVNENQAQVERRPDSLVKRLRSGQRVFDLDVGEDGVPVVGAELTLGDGTTVAFTSNYPVMRGDEVVGEGQVSETVDKAPG